MTINSQTVLLGLIGNPAKHSLSPLIHNGIFQQRSMNAAYLCFEVQPKDLKPAVSSLRSLGAKGFNLTIPYKEKVLSLLDEVSEDARLIKAVNTVKNQGGRLVGYNTDGPGFIDSLKLKGRFSPREKNVCILGAGGAAKAVSFCLCKEEAASVSIYDLERARAEALARGLRKLFKKTRIVVLDAKEQMSARTNLLVNATGVGMKERDPALFDAAFLERFPGLLVYDLIYAPAQPPLLKEAQKARLPVMNGLWMLIYQALRALTIWFERDDFLRLGDFCYNLLPEQEVEKR